MNLSICELESHPLDHSGNLAFKYESIYDVVNNMIFFLFVIYNYA